MAFGKPPENKGLKISPTIADQLWQAKIRSEDMTAEIWKRKWGWILTQYKILQNNMQEMSKRSIQDHAKKDTKDRTIKPIPESIAHECGWLASRKEFRLEKYGPDVYKYPPLYKLDTSYFEK